MNSKMPRKLIHLQCQYEGCLSWFWSSPQRKWCDLHKALMRKVQQATWAKANKTSGSLERREAVYKFKDPKSEWVEDRSFLWEIGICNRCGQTLLLERTPIEAQTTYQLRCVMCGQFTTKEVRGIMATEPLKQKLERIIETWGGIYVQRKGSMVQFCDLSEAEQAKILRSWLEQYVQEDSKRVETPTILGSTNRA